MSRATGLLSFAFMVIALWLLTEPRVIAWMVGQ